MKSLPLLLAITWLGLWYTPDQLGQHYYQRGDYSKASQSFDDPFWKGVAEFKAGDFKQAAQTFARVESPQGRYNQGNALVMLGKYNDAIATYDRALKARPDWQEAKENRALAKARAKMLELQGGDVTEGQVKPDKIVFDENKKSDDQSTEVTAGGKLSNSEIQALWLRRVRTRPADFLKAKFAYQLAKEADGDAP